MNSISLMSMSYSLRCKTSVLTKSADIYNLPLELLRKLLPAVEGFS